MKSTRRIGDWRSNQNIRGLWQKIVCFEKPDRIPLIEIEMIRDEVLQR